MVTRMDYIVLQYIYSDWRSWVRARNGRLTIGDLSRRTGTKVQTIRYYEQIGLLPEPERSSGNQRLYSPAHSERLALIRHGREIGFPLASIRELLSLSDHPSHNYNATDTHARTQPGIIKKRLAPLLYLNRQT